MPHSCHYPPQEACVPKKDSKLADKSFPDLQPFQIYSATSHPHDEHLSCWNASRLTRGLVFFLLCYGFKPARCWTLIPAEAINEFWLLSHDWAMTWHLDLLHGGSVSPFWTLICSRWLWPMNKVYFYSSITRKGSRMLSFLSLSDVDTIVLKVMKNTFVL